MLGFAWASFAVLAVGTILFCYVFVRYYQDKHESERLTTIVAVIGLSITIWCLLLVPVDIYSVSVTRDLTTGEQIMKPDEIANNSLSMFVLYVIFYCVVLIFIALVLPFSYFYYEEDDEDVTGRMRARGAIKYTLFFFIGVVILLVIGLLLKPGDEKGKIDWADALLDSAHAGEGTISFAIACMMLLGYLLWVFYTAYGLSAIPVKMIKGKLNPDVEREDVTADLAVTREKTRALESKYQLTGKRISKKDKRHLDQLKRQERLLQGRSDAIGETKTTWHKITSCLRPFTLAIGAFLLLLTLFLVTSIIMSSIDKASSECGSLCGFMLQAPSVNPYDLLMTALAPAFPIDYLVNLSVMAYIFFASMAGIVAIGIRFIWVHVHYFLMYRVKKATTVPQAILMLTGTLMLIVLSLNAEILTIAPQYSAFGSQRYLDDKGKVVACSVNAPKGVCTMTQVASFILRAQTKMPFFGIVFFAANWLFVVVFLIGLVVSLVRKKQSNVSRVDDSDSDIDNFA